MTVVSRILIYAVRVLLPLAILSTGYLYLYPVFHGCAFPVPGPGPGPGSGHSRDGFMKTLRGHFHFRGVQGTQEDDTSNGDDNGQEAIFRLLVLADPQLEGDSSLPSAGFFERLSWVLFDDDDDGGETGGGADEDEDEDDSRPRFSLISQRAKQKATAVMQELVRSAQAARKTLDLVGNDYYLAHIYRTLHWWTRPSHVTVLGDLIGSQWVSDEEFDVRGQRYWRRVFRGGERVAHLPSEDGYDVLRPGSRKWSRKIINIAGNHDIGYSGDISEARLARFERVFGPANWDTHFHLPTGSSNTGDEGDNVNNTRERRSIHLINLNSLPLDSPSLSEPIQTSTYNYINDVLTHRSPPVQEEDEEKDRGSSSFTLLLTHLPLHKEAGICPDAPYIAYHDEDDPDGRFREGGLREQNHLSREVSAQAILQGVFGMSGDGHAVAGGRGRNGVILNGHDHEGCDVVHYVDRGSEGDSATATATGSVSESGDESGDQGRNWTWKAARYNGTVPQPGVREVTLRSMMGEFGGNAGLLSVWFDTDGNGDGNGNGTGQWQYEIQMCRAGVQHIWWAVHVLDLVVLGLACVVFLSGRTGLSGLSSGDKQSGNGNGNDSKLSGKQTVPSTTEQSHEKEKNEKKEKE